MLDVTTERVFIHVQYTHFHLVLSCTLRMSHFISWCHNTLMCLVLWTGQLRPDHFGARNMLLRVLIIWIDLVVQLAWTMRTPASGSVCAPEKHLAGAKAVQFQLISWPTALEATNWDCIAHSPLLVFLPGSRHLLWTDLDSTTLWLLYLRHLYCGYMCCIGLAFILCIKVGKNWRINHNSELDSDWTKKSKIHCEQQLIVEDSCSWQEKLKVMEKKDSAILQVVYIHVLLGAINACNIVKGGCTPYFPKCSQSKNSRGWAQPLN